ncbi:MAG: energy transducer TonB [Blastocatellia bacterium]
MNSFAMTIMAALCLFLNSRPEQSPWETRAVADAQRTLASDLDAELPRLSFRDWFEKVVGPGTAVVWQLSECGGMTEASSNATGDLQACVEVNTILPDGRHVIVMVAVGTFKKGMTAAPTFHFGVIKQKGELRPIQRLRDLPKLLSTPRSLANRPAVRLPELNTPKVKLAANSAHAFGSPVWGGEEFGRLMLIEEPEPPPPEPPQTRPATSNSTSNAERRDAPAGVRQGAPTFKPQPKYPRNVRRFNASGRVEVRVTISVTGRVTKAIAISGHPLLRDAAVEAALRWEFEPTLVDGAPVETELVLTFDFVAPPPS